MTHRVLLGRVHFDVPSSRREANRAFWATALATTTRPGRVEPEFDVFEHPASLAPVVVQDVGTDGPRIHLDIETDDLEAEVSRLVSAGAVEVRRQDVWVVLRDPAGLLFCVVPVDSPDFSGRSVEVG